MRGFDCRPLDAQDMNCIMGLTTSDKPALLIIRLLFGFAFNSVFVKLTKNINKLWDGNAVYTTWKALLILHWLISKLMGQLQVIINKLCFRGGRAERVAATSCHLLLTRSLFLPCPYFHFELCGWWEGV